MNHAENYFSLLKRGINGTFHSVSEAHLGRYLVEFDFRYSNRVKLGVDDEMRAARAFKGIEGKRLTYDQPCYPSGGRKSRSGCPQTDRGVHLTLSAAVIVLLRTRRL